MLVSELMHILKDCNPNARVVLCHEGFEKNSKQRKCFYGDIEDVGYRQMLNEDRTKLICDENILQVWSD